MCKRTTVTIASFCWIQETGRALIEGGRYFTEPSTALVSGDTTRTGSAIKLGEIATGFRLEIWVNNRIVSTSPVQSITVCHPVSDFATKV